MTQTNTTRTLFKVTRVLGILLIGGSAFVLKHGEKTVRKGLQHADQTPQQIMVPPTNVAAEAPVMVARAVVSSGKAALAGTRKISAPSNTNGTAQSEQHKTPHPVKYSQVNPVEATASFD